MPKLFDAPIENIITAMRKERTAKRTFAFEQIIERRILRNNGTPVIEGESVYFFFRNAEEKKISLVGDMNNWKPGADVLERIHPKSLFYFIKKEFPMDARLSYRFQAGNEDSFNDPLNPHSLQEVFGTNTYLRMPGYRDPEYWHAPAKKAPTGKLIDLKVKGSGKVAGREVLIYLPRNIQIRSKQRVIYINDGAQAISVGKYVNVLDNIFYHEPHIPKCVAVFVPPADRQGEYLLNEDFSKWFVSDLVRQVESKLKIKSEAKLRAIQGASLGGLLATYVGMNYPDVFGNIIAQSPSFWVSDETIIREFDKKDIVPLRFYLHTGTINDARSGTMKMLKVLQRKGYDVTYRETTESHNWANWSGKYADSIRWLGRVSI